jgi:hypothetical protein
MNSYLSKISPHGKSHIILYLSIFIFLPNGFINKKVKCIFKMLFKIQKAHTAFLKTLNWGMIDLEKLYIFKVYNLMNLESIHPWKIQQSMTFTHPSPLKFSSHLFIMINYYCYFMIKTQHKFYKLSKILIIWYSIFSHRYYEYYLIFLK